MSDWKAYPDSSGWWEYKESERDASERVLLGEAGACVVSDDEWEQVVGRTPSEVLCENYWEGSDTKTQMPGFWRKEPTP